MKIGIVGLGLIGGSYAKALFQCGYEVFGIDVDIDTLAYAEKEGFITKGYMHPENILKELDVIFLCLYPSQLKMFFQKHMKDFKEGAVISDVGGIKRIAIDAYNTYKRTDVDFIAAHPMAGKEKSGVEASDASIFENANLIITKTKDNKQENIDLIRLLANQMGFKTVSVMSDKEHDQAISYTSQLTHALAMALINSDDGTSQTKALIGDSFRDLTRIASINEILWSELFVNNKDYLLQSITRFEASLHEIKQALMKKDTETLRKLMVNATKRRQSLDE